MRGAKLLALGGFTLALWIPREAAAHIEITSHATRHGVNYQKVGPCGLADEGPGEPVAVYAPGDTVALAWHEFIDHPGHYRVSFDPSGQDAFVDPATVDDLFNSPTVELDGIEDLADVHDYQAELLLPDDVECEACTIQIIQVMTDKPPFGDGNDIYYHCIDIRVVADEPGDGDGDPSGDGDGDPSGDGDGDPSGDGDGDPSGDGDTTGETGTPVDDADDGCSCSSAPVPSRDGFTLALLSLGLLAGRRSRRRAP